MKLKILLLLVLSGMAFAAEPRTLAVDGLGRSYLVYRPDTLDRARPVPLVIMLHGALGSGEQAEKSYGWDAAADRAGFVVAYPDGLHRTWNAGGMCCGRARRDGVNDVAFLDSLIDTLVRDQTIDPKRIYITGMSNGGAMTYRYACEGRHAVAAIGPVASSFTFACNSVRPTSVMAIHGLSDKTVPFAGGPGRRGHDIQWLPVQASLDVFRDADRCDGPVQETVGAVSTATGRCDKGRTVTLITIADAGHQWPGGKREKGVFGWLILDPPSPSLDATTALWGFFARHPAD